MPIQLNTTSSKAKMDSAKHITRVAVMLTADFIALAMESYTLPQSMVHRHAEFVDEYGSLAKCPHSIPEVSFSIETPDAIWLARCTFRAVGRSKKKKTFVLPSPGDFLGAVEGAGTFVGLLPGSKIVGAERVEAMPTLH